MGPATIIFTDDTDTHTDTHRNNSLDQDSQRGGSSRRGAGGPKQAPLPEGASWTWQYPFHYGPLMCDLSSTAQMYRPSPARTAALFCPPLRVARCVCVCMCVWGWGWGGGQLEW